MQTEAAMSAPQKTSGPLSALHAMLGNLERQRDAGRINEIVNHPEIYPWVRGPSNGPLDLSKAIANTDVIALLGTHGGLLFHRLQPGIFEVHSQVLPEGRGAWAELCIRACLHWLFTRTEAVEIVTRCPKGNVAATAMARTVGMAREFTNPRGWINGDQPLAADIYSMTIQHWMRAAPGLVERGEWFHRRLEAELARHGVDASYAGDQTHDRYAGAAYEMLLSGQTDKAVLFYNRVAVMAGYPTIAITERRPLEIDLGSVTIAMRGDDFWVPDVRPLH